MAEKIDRNPNASDESLTLSPPSNDELLELYKTTLEWSEMQLKKVSAVVAKLSQPEKVTGMGAGAVVIDPVRRQHAEAAAVEALYWQVICGVLGATVVMAESFEKAAKETKDGGGA